NPLAAQFGVWGDTASIVIGRDGRFAAERTSGDQLAAAVEQALAKPLDSALSQAEPSRLTVELAADGGEHGVPGATMALTAIDAAGRIIRKDKVAPLASLRRLVWRYPALSKGGQVSVPLSGRGIAEQTQALKSPAAAEKLRFVVPSPRSIKGRVVAIN